MDQKIIKMRICFILFLSIFFSFACKKTTDIVTEVDNGTPPVTTNTGSGTEFSYLALGDSYTIGQSVSEAERWPVILAKDLNAQKIKVAKPEIIATTGWTTTDLLFSLANKKPGKTYDMVSLLIGVNNQYQGQPAEGFRQPFRQLLLKSIELAGGKASRVFVLSIPDWGVSRYGASFDRKQIAIEIDQFNAVAKAECAKEKVRFIDITEISRIALNNPSMIASDGLHFSGEMHQLWVDTVIPQIKGYVLNN